MRFDDSELRAWQRQLRTTPIRVRAEAMKIVRKGAMNIRDDARKRVREAIRPKFLPKYAPQITSEVLGGGLSAEVGPLDEGQGQLGRGVEFGSRHAGPIPHMLPAADAEEPLFQGAMGALAMGALE